jgi:Na+/H+ antiporter NhaD/arsenite permease-like protein
MTMTLLQSEPQPRAPKSSAKSGRFSTLLENPFFPLAVVTVAIAGLSTAHIGHIAAAARHFPFEILAIFIALEFYTAMVIGTGVASALAVRLAKWGRASRGMTLVTSVIVLIATCAMGNNLTHVGLILPVLLVLLRTLSADRRYLIAFFACVMTVVNLAGASTPVGDFPALTILASGITSFNSYLVLAFPLFAVLTAGTLLGVYLLLLRSTAGAKNADTDLQNAGVILLQARYRHAQVDKRSLIALLAVLGGMFGGWVFLHSVPPWVVAWAGAAVGSVVAPRVRSAARVDAVDLYPALKIGAFLAGATYLSTTGLLQFLARLLQDNLHTPTLMIVALMAVVAVMTALLSAGPTAATLLPLCQALVAPGAVLAGKGSLLAVAFAGAICAGSSALLWSATAGPLIARKVQSAGLRDESGRPIAFTARAYLPWGLLNASIQFVVAVVYVLIVYNI